MKKCPGKGKINNKTGNLSLFAWWFNSYATHICIFYCLQSVSPSFILFNTQSFWGIQRRYYFLQFTMRKLGFTWLNILPKVTKLSGKLYICKYKQHMCYSGHLLNNDMTETVNIKWIGNGSSLFSAIQSFVRKVSKQVQENHSGEVL